MWTPSAEEIATSVPIDGDVRPRSTIDTIDELRPVRSAIICSVNPCSTRNARIRPPSSVRCSSAVTTV